jgi:hypothetical protein
MSICEWHVPKYLDGYPLVMTNKKLLKMAIEIVDFPIQNGDLGNGISGNVTGRTEGWPGMVV